MENKDFMFKARDIYTNEEMTFSLKDIIFSDKIRDSLHEEMEHEFLGLSTDFS